MGAGQVSSTFSSALIKSDVAPKINFVRLSIPVVLNRKGVRNTENWMTTVPPPV